MTLPMSLEESRLGWYLIEETWELHVGNDLKDVEVYAANVAEGEHGLFYTVKHYDRSGDVISTYKLHEDDVLRVFADRDTVSNPLPA